MSASMSNSGEREHFEVGSQVKILKEGTQKGNTAVVIQSDWYGQMKVRMTSGNDKGGLKSYVAVHLEQLEDEVAEGAGEESEEEEVFDSVPDVSLNDDIHDGKKWVELLQLVSQ